MTENDNVSKLQKPKEKLKSSVCVLNTTVDPDVKKMNIRAFSLKKSFAGDYESLESSIEEDLKSIDRMSKLKEMLTDSEDGMINDSNASNSSNKKNKSLKRGRSKKKESSKHREKRRRKDRKSRRRNSSEQSCDGKKNGSRKHKKVRKNPFTSSEDDEAVKNKRSKTDVKKSDKSRYVSKSKSKKKNYSIKSTTLGSFIREKEDSLQLPLIPATLDFRQESIGIPPLPNEKVLPLPQEPTQLATPPPPPSMDLITPVPPPNVQQKILPRPPQQIVKYKSNRSSNTISTLPLPPGTGTVPVMIKETNKLTHNKIKLSPVSQKPISKSLVSDHLTRRDRARTKMNPIANVDWGERSVEYFFLAGQIGEGTYGQVYKAIDINHGQLRALKKIRLENEKEGFPITAIREIRILRNLNHENIIQLSEMITDKSTAEDFEHDKGAFFLVFEYMDHDLLGLLESGMVTFTDLQIASIMKQILLGLDYCHKFNFIHRDLKCSNILVNNDGVVKIADFGLARYYDSEHKRRYTNKVVTLWYRSPELLFGQELYNKSIDIWSCGCIIGELYSKKPIFQANVEIQQLELICKMCGTPTPADWAGIDSLPGFVSICPKVAYKRRVRENFSFLPLDALNIMDKMLTMDPSRRGTTEKLLKYPLFANINLKNIKFDLPSKENCRELWSKLRKKTCIKNDIEDYSETESLNKYSNLTDYLSSHSISEKNRKGIFSHLLKMAQNRTSVEPLIFSKILNFPCNNDRDVDKLKKSLEPILLKLWRNNNKLLPKNVLGLKLSNPPLPVKSSSVSNSPQATRTSSNYKSRFNKPCEKTDKKTIVIDYMNQTAPSSIESSKTTTSPLITIRKPDAAISRRSDSYSSRNYDKHSYKNHPYRRDKY